MNWMDRFHALHFDDHNVLDEQVDALSEFHLFAVEHNRQSNLAGDRESAFSYFVSETRLIGAFQQSGP